MGNLGGFVAPNLKVWADEYFGSSHAGLYLLAGFTHFECGIDCVGEESAGGGRGGVRKISPLAVGLRSMGHLIATCIAELANYVLKKGITAVIFLLVLFVLFCVGTVMISRIHALQLAGTGFNLTLISLSLSMLAVWYGLHRFWPPLSIWEHWRMVMISLVGFLSMLLSAVLALRSRLIRSGFFATISVGMGAIHLLNLVTSIPVS
jgi:hypothetical protein